MIELLLVFIAIILFVLIEPINFLYTVVYKRKSFKGYMKSLALAIDKFGNYQFRSILNAIVITKDGYQFGNFNETISSVLGKNELRGTLTKFGEFIVLVLDTIDEDHCFNSVNTNINE